MDVTAEILELLCDFDRAPRTPEVVEKGLETSLPIRAVDAQPMCRS